MSSRIGSIVWRTKVRTAGLVIDSGFALRAHRNDGGAPAAPSPLPPVAGVLRQIAVLGLLADVLFFVVAMALGGVEGNTGRAAGALVALVVLGNRRDGFCAWFCHARSPFLVRRKR